MISIISFTQRGYALARRLAEREKASGDRRVMGCLLYSKWSGAAESADVEAVGDLTAWTGEQFAAHHTLLFIGACGIAVRSIAPSVQNKLTDSAVLVMDEAGKYVIPLLAGHVGGANDIAGRIAQLVGATPVLTTATDVSGVFAVDVWAVENGFAIQNKERIRQVSAKLLQKETVKIGIAGLTAVQCGEFLVQSGAGGAGQLQPCDVAAESATSLADLDILVAERLPAGCQALWLRPREYVLGMGCRRGKSLEELQTFVQAELNRAEIDPADICALASIERKRDEIGLARLADALRLPFLVYPEAELAQLEGSYSASAFVEQTVGVDNVCERAAMVYCGGRGEVFLQKRAAEGMTLAVVKRDWRA